MAHPQIDFSTTATDIMEDMLLVQYENSDNLKEYMMCFLEEANLLYVEMNKVYIGRMLEHAVGAQLDVIGRILQQSRNIIISIDGFFGFQTVPDVLGMADEADPTNGGVFQSEEGAGFTLIPIADDPYRNLLFARAYATNVKDMSINTVYEILNLIMGFEVKARILEVGKDVEIQLDDTTVTQQDVDLLQAVQHWFIPMTTSVTFTLYSF